MKRFDYIVGRYKVPVTTKNPICKATLAAVEESALLNGVDLYDVTLASTRNGTHTFGIADTAYGCIAWRASDDKRVPFGLFSGFYVNDEVALEGGPTILTKMSHSPTLSDAMADFFMKLHVQAELRVRRLKAAQNRILDRTKLSVALINMVRAGHVPPSRLEDAIKHLDALDIASGFDLLEACLIAHRPVSDTNITMTLCDRVPELVDFVDALVKAPKR